MRAFLAFLALFVLSAVAMTQAGSNALILIQPGIAGSAGGVDAYGYPRWVVWPDALRPGNQAALISLISGFDWSIDPVHALGVPADDSAFAVHDAAEFERKGVFAAERRSLGSIRTYVIDRNRAAITENELLLGMHDASGQVRIAPWKSRWPTHSLMLYEAKSWDEVAAVAARIDGRTLVVEYPPATGTPWTRYWTYRKGWKLDSLPVGRRRVPGLIDARDVSQLLLHPERFTWVKDDSWQRGAANRWLDMGHRGGPAVLVCMGVFAGAAGLATVVVVFGERRAPTLAYGLQAVILSPAAIVSAGSLAHRMGVASLPLLIPICLVLLWVAALLLGLIQKLALVDAHPLLGTAVVGFLSMTLADPLWSPLSNALGWLYLPVSADALGCWFAYLVGAIACVRGANLTCEWCLRALVLALCLWPLQAPVWWAPSTAPYIILPILALAFGEGFWRWIFAPAVVGFGFLSNLAWFRGVTWTPGGLLTTFTQARLVDLSSYVRASATPLAFTTLTVVALVCLFGNRFFLHQMKKLAFTDPRRTAPIAAAGGLALLSPAEPAFLSAAVWCAIGGLLALLYDGALNL